MKIISQLLNPLRIHSHEIYNLPRCPPLPLRTRKHQGLFINLHHHGSSHPQPYHIAFEKVMPQTEAHYCLGDGDGGGEEESCAKGGFGIAEE